ncbi:MAG: glycosyltransferase family 9 protein [Bacteroidota bacterium]
MFRITRLILLRLPALFRFFAKFRRNEKRLLVIKTDAIGDYILFRNFLGVLKTSKTYKGYRIDLLGNVLWRDVSLKYDSPYVGQFMFIKAEALYESPLQTLKTGWKLFKNNYEVVLQPTFSRTFITDGLAALTAAKCIIGFESDTERMPIKYKRKTDNFYTRLLPLPAGVYFEFDRSKCFIESVTGEPIALNSTSIGPDVTYKNGVIIFPGAGVVKREWKKENLLALIKLLKQHSSQPIYLAGSNAEIPAGEYLEANLPPQSIINQIGKSSLPELIEMIANSSLVIANDTSAIHMAVATKTNSVCIVGGGHFERFVPYPEYFENRPVSAYYKMDCYYCNWNCIFKTADTEPYPCIANVDVNTVWDSVRPLLITAG